MKILHLIPTLGQGGAERLVLNIVAELSKRSNVEVKLLTFSSENAYPFLTENIDWHVVPSRVVPSVFGKPTLEVGTYRTFLTHFRPDVVHSHLFEAELVAREVLQTGVRYFSHFHDNMPPLRKFSPACLLSKDKMLRFFERQWILKRYKKCDNHFISISKNGQQYLKTQLPPQLRKNICLLPNAIALSRFFSPKTYAPNRTPWQLVTVGRLHPCKGHPFLLEVVAYLKQKGHAVVLKVIGDGAEKQNLQQQIAQQKLTEEVKLLGHQSFPEELLKCADLYLHAGVYETFGLVLVEAMATGLPVVTTDGGGNRDLIENNYNGFMLPKREVADFAEKVIFLLENPEERIRMGKNAQSFSKKFGITKYVDKLLKHYKAQPQP